LCKRLISGLAVLLMLVMSCGAECYAMPQISAESAVLIEAAEGRIVCEKNSHEVRSMASTTKIMTAIVAIEYYSSSSLPLDGDVTVDSRAVGVEGSSIYLRPDERLTMEALLYAMLLESANDAAAAIAFEVGGSIENFAVMMNEKAAELGLEHTSYANPHGLDDENNHSCAHDLAVLGAYALKNEEFRRIVSTKKQVITNADGDSSRLLVNHNKLLRLYDGTVGIKTGYTKKSGRCLVSAAERDGVLLIAVTLGAPDDWNDHMALFDYGFEKFECTELASAGSESFTLPVIGGEAEFIECTNSAPMRAVVEKGGAVIGKTVELKRFYYAPITAGDLLGYVSYTVNGSEIGRLELYAQSDVPVTAQKGMLERIADFFRGIFAQ